MENPIENLYLSQRSFYNLIIAAVVLSMGINIIVSDLSCGIYWGIALACGSLLFLAYREVKLLRTTKKIDAVMLFDQKEHKLVKIPNYEFSRDVCDFLNAAIAESSDIKGLWESEPIGLIPISHNMSELEYKSSKTNSLMSQLIEYILIDRLSLTTEAYFHISKIDDNRTLTRNDINDYVATNPFVALFSKPPSERAAFGNEKDYDDNICFMFGENDVIYNRFELVIPNKCILKRGKHGMESSTIVLSHPFFTLEIISEFTGDNANLPINFEEMYLGKFHNDISCYSVPITIRFTPSFFSFLFLRRRYYRWIDRYISCMEDYASFDKFIEKIQWYNVNAMICCQKNITSQQGRTD